MAVTKAGSQQQSALQTREADLTQSSAGLEQNTPNPFSGSATINYMLPKQYSSAMLVITGSDGKIVKMNSLSGHGKGSYTISGSGLSAGSYSYSLQIDGKLADSKQMIIQK
jgi:hypothetical protein